MAVVVSIIHANDGRSAPRWDNVDVRDTRQRRRRPARVCVSVQRGRATPRQMMNNSVAAAAQRRQRYRSAAAASSARGEPSSLIFLVVNLDVSSRRAVHGGHVTVSLDGRRIHRTPTAVTGPPTTRRTTGPPCTASSDDGHLRVEKRLQPVAHPGTGDKG